MSKSLSLQQSILELIYTHRIQYGKNFLDVNTYEKSVDPILSLVPRHKGLRIALIVETSNAESPTPV